MLSHDTKEFLTFAIIALLVAAVVVGLMYFAASAKCSRQWENSGFPSEYRAFQGCRIKLKDGRWIPAQNYREL